MVRWSLLRLGITALLSAGVSWEAAAQAFVGGDVQRGVTVLTRPRPDFDPLGVRLGAFKLDATATAGVGYDSNLFGRDFSVVGSGYSNQTANVTLNSDWTTHAVGVFGGMDSRQYWDSNTFNWTDWNIGTYGRYDFSSQTNIRADYQHQRSHYNVYSYDVQAAGIFQPVPYSSDQFQVTGNTAFNRLGLQAAGFFQTYRFEDQNLAGGQNLAVQDFNIAGGIVGASYMLTPGRFLTSSFYMRNTNYNEASQSFRDGITWQALAGFRYDFDGVWQATISGGWIQRNFNGPNPATGGSLKSAKGPAIDASVIWTPTQLTTVTLNINTTIQESIRGDAVSYRQYRGTLGVDHELYRNILLLGQLGVQRSDYPSTGVNPGSVITGGLATAGATWLINRHLALVGTYTFEHRFQCDNCSPGFNNWNRNLVLVSLRAGL